MRGKGNKSLCVCLCFLPQSFDPEKKGRWPQGPLGGCVTFALKTSRVTVFLFSSLPLFGPLIPKIKFSSGSFVPVALNCGHSICSTCWHQILSSPTSPSCPFCMKECSVSVGKNYSLIELLEAVDGVGEERKDEGEEEKKCEICGEEEQKMVCCDCGEGCRRQCESCCVHLHQLDQLSIHRRTQIKRKEKKGEEKEEEKEEEEQIKEEDKKEGDEDEAEKKGKSKQKPKRRKKKSKGVSKKGSTQVSPIATKVMSLLNQKKHISAFFTAFHHAWSGLFRQIVFFFSFCCFVFVERNDFLIV